MKKISDTTREIGDNKEGFSVILTVEESNAGIEISAKEFEAISMALTNRIRAIEKYPELVNNMVLIYLVALFDAFILDSIKAIISHKKEILRSSKQITYDEVLEFEHISSLHSYMIEKETVDLGYKSLKDEFKFINSKFGINIKECAIKVDELSEIHATRNLLVHNKGIVNQAYKDTVPNSKLDIGNRRAVTDDYFKEAQDKILTVVKFLHKSFTDKFCTSENKDATSPNTV